MDKYSLVFRTFNYFSINSYKTQSQNYYLQFVLKFKNLVSTSFTSSLPVKLLLVSRTRTPFLKHILLIVRMYCTYLNDMCEWSCEL